MEEHLKKISREMFRLACHNEMEKHTRLLMSFWLPLLVICLLKSGALMTVPSMDASEGKRLYSREEGAIKSATIIIPIRLLEGWKQNSTFSVAQQRDEALLRANSRHSEEQAWKHAGVTSGSLLAVELGSLQLYEQACCTAEGLTCWLCRIQNSRRILWRECSSGPRLGHRLM